MMGSFSSTWQGMILRLRVSTPSWTTRRTGIIEEPISPLPTVTLRHGAGGIRGRCRCTALESRFHWQWLLQIIQTLRASRLRPAGRSQRPLDFFQRLPLRHSGPGKEALCKAGHLHFDWIRKPGYRDRRDGRVTGSSGIPSVVSHKQLELFSPVFSHSGAGATGLDLLQRLFAPV